MEIAETTAALRYRTIRHLIPHLPSGGTHDRPAAAWPTGDYDERCMAPSPRRVDLRCGSAAAVSPVRRENIAHEEGHVAGGRHHCQVVCDPARSRRRLLGVPPAMARREAAEATIQT